MDSKKRLAAALSYFRVFGKENFFKKVPLNVTKHLIFTSDEVTSVRIHADTVCCCIINTNVMNTMYALYKTNCSVSDRITLMKKSLFRIQMNLQWLTKS